MGACNAVTVATVQNDWSETKSLTPPLIWCFVEHGLWFSVFVNSISEGALSELMRKIAVVKSHDQLLQIVDTESQEASFPGLSSIATVLY